MLGMKNMDLLSVPELVLMKIILQIADVKTLLHLASTNSYIYALIYRTRRRSPLVAEGRSLVVVRGDVILGAVESQTSQCILNFTEIDSLLTIFRFHRVKLRTSVIQNDDDCCKFKPLRGYCSELIIELDNYKGNQNIGKLVEILQPSLAKISIGSYALYSPELIYSLDDCKAVDITVSDIQRITNDLRYFIYPHEIVILRVKLFSVNMISRMFRRWDQNQYSFGDLKRLEFHITDPNFVYSPKYLLRRRNTRFLGAPHASNGGAVILGNERRALIIFESFRLVFIPLTFLDEELLILVEEFCQKVPLDVSGILSSDHPFCKILSLQKSLCFEEW